MSRIETVLYAEIIDGRLLRSTCLTPGAISLPAVAAYGCATAFLVTKTADVAPSPSARADLLFIPSIGSSRTCGCTAINRSRLAQKIRSAKSCRPGRAGRHPARTRSERVSNLGLLLYSREEKGPESIRVVSKTPS